MSDVLGLDRDMHEAYHALLRERTCTAADLCERLGMSPARAGAALDRLMAAGLVATVAAGGPRPPRAAPQPARAPRRWVPLDPRHSLAPLLARRQARLIARQQEFARTQSALGQLASAYSAHGRPDDSPAEVSRGQLAVRARVQDMLASSRSAVMCFVAEESWPIASDIRSPVEHAVRRGVAVRAVYASGILTEETVRAHARWLVSIGGGARTLPALPPTMLVVDRETALVRGDSGTATASVVHNRALATALASLFDQVWGGARGACDEEAAPEVVQLGEPPTPQERDLLRLLGQGMTDASAARHLGVSLRTVRRMMAELMARLGARSRFEAGIRAAERGWIDSGPTAPSRRTARAAGRATRRAAPRATPALNG